MEQQRRALQTFLSLHAQKAEVTREPCVYLYHYSEDMPYDLALLRLSRDDVVGYLDTESELVRWTLEQMRTYDCTRQCIVGLIFDKSTVLTEVLYDRDSLP